MSATNRIRRPVLDRTHPIRRWSTLFAFPGVPADTGAGRNDERGAAVDDAVARAVDLGYRVIDEYVSQGRKAAQRLNERAYDPQAASSDLQDLTARMAQYASEATALWMDFMQRAVAATPAAMTREPAAAPPRSFHSASPPASASSVPTPDLGSERARVTLEIAAAQPVEVSLDLRAAAAGRRLLVHGLRAVDADQPRLADVSFEPATADEPLRLRLRVPADQPPGVYSGLLIDEETSRPVGMLSAIVGASRGADGE